MGTQKDSKVARVKVCHATFVENCGFASIKFMFLKRPRRDKKVHAHPTPDIDTRVVGPRGSLWGIKGESTNTPKGPPTTQDLARPGPEARRIFKSLVPPR